MFCIYSPLEAKFFPALWVFYSDVVLSGPVDFQTGLPERREHISPAGDGSPLDALPQIFVNGFLGVGSIILARRFAPAEQPGFVQVGVFRGVQAGAGRVVRPGPSLPVVVQVTEHVKMLLPAGRAGIERLAADQLHTRDDEMQLMVARVGMPHPQDVALIWLQPRESHFFKIVHNPLFLFRRHRIVRVPGKHTGGELPFGVQRVDKAARSFHIPAQHFRRQFVPARIIRADKVMRGAVTTALAVRKDFHIHDGSSLSGGGGVSMPFSSRSRLTRATSTSMTSARPL